MTDITELAQSLKAAAEKATPGEWVYFPKNTSIEYDVGSDESQGSILYVDSGDFTQPQTDRNGEFIALANPANVLALVEALEKAQAAERRWHRVASRIHEQACESDVKIDELEAIRAAAEKLVRCKGRYHSEQNYRALAALFGVKTPDLPPLEHENVHYADAAEMEIAALRQRIAELEPRAVTVKLPNQTEFDDPLSAYEAIEKCKEALTAQGIKWEAE
ncbi:ead/Ea22-like family protein [Klebsiella pneumoniae]|uniref:ead/Ea22-like family protein n=1 Tax=Klebsiella pneumoniae TaxID=573 RepID=UPI000E203BDC|nr:ead/Ea22-like family protein [Klebsiella pneumoniae]MCI8031084.1 ead/Ea22-like family protein [Klebsiella pneumoniae]SWY95529.1 Ead domain protein [Klebsiella pneumoniae]HBR4428706.1 ead/Ea22-like family protein [Klebsiella pneumoniae]HBR4437155.1 ead/Ea22-like family protein [Klebsiella pneumoniae]HBR5034311.1 ead/Ea22-like family protein [Klebsiella pneumoniae]